MSGVLICHDAPYFKCVSYDFRQSPERWPMLFLRLDQALELEAAAAALKERLVIRYMLWNGLSSMEVAAARIEHLDPVECTLFLPRRHWKRNQVCAIDPETVRLQAIYAGSRKKGPLVRSRLGGHYRPQSLFYLVRRIARRTTIPENELIGPRVLKRTFAREWLLASKNVGSLQKQLGHKYLSSTAHYLRFVLDDVRRNHLRLMRRVKHGQERERARLVS